MAAIAQIKTQHAMHGEIRAIIAIVNIIQRSADGGFIQQIRSAAGHGCQLRKNRGAWMAVSFARREDLQQEPLSAIVIRLGHIRHKIHPLKTQHSS